MSENKALRVNHYGHSSSGKVDVLSSFGASELTIRFPGVVTEIKYTLPETLSVDLYSNRDMFDDQLAKIKDLHGQKVALDSNKFIVAPIRFSIFESKNLSELEKKFKAEITEILEHFEAIMKAHMIDFATERYKALQSELDARNSHARKMLDQVIERGEEAIPHEQD